MNTQKEDYSSDTFRLMKKAPSCIEGMISIVDFRDIIDKYNTDETEKEADIKSSYSDWKAVGEDFKKSLREVDLKYDNTTE